MNTNHDFRIGKDHEICQDYAVSGVQGDFAYAIVCDGCSSSPDVDFGARVLAISAREMLREMRAKTLDYGEFGRKTIRRADIVSAIMPSVDRNFLDSTLLLAWVEGGVMTAMMYGDGVFFHKSGNTLRAVHVNFKVPMDGEMKPAPDYLSYHMEEFRKERYENLGGTKIVNDCIIQEGPGISGTVSHLKPFEPVMFQAPVGPGDVIAMCSDGIDSFWKPDNTQVPWQSLVNDFIGFKTTAGVFVKRRMTAFQRECQKQLITHVDDISLAAIVI